jgi:predicted DNA binding CopG/RHH family protein
MPKKVNFNVKPSTPNVDSWVNTRSVEAEAEVQVDVEPVSKPKMKRLTLDITEELHKAIKLKSVQEGVPMADLLRVLLEKNFL